MSSRQPDELIGLGDKEWTHANEERTCTLLDEGLKSRIDIAFVGGGENDELLRYRTRRCLCIPDLRFGRWLIRVDEEGDSDGIRH